MKKYVIFLQVTFWMIIAQIFSFNWIVGSWLSTFSFSSMMAPALACQFGLTGIFLYFLFKAGLLCCVSGMGFLLFFIHRLPLFCAGFVFTRRSYVFNILIPISCQILFVCHSVGMQAWPYCLYWFIPVLCFFMEDNVWIRALAGSFVAHAVGSVVWLYSVHIPAVVWLSLIPIVFCERILIALGIVLCNDIVVRIKNFVLKKVWAGKKWA